MQKKYTQPYSTHRKNAQLSQEKAAERLHISRRSLSDYERCLTPVPHDIAERMSELYNAPGLIYEHVLYNPVLGKYFADVLKDYIV